MIATTACQSAPPRVEPVDTTKSQVDLGNQYARDGLLREAIASYRSAITSSPSDSAARRNLGLVLVKIGDYANAVIELEEASKSFGADFDTNFFLGEAYRGQDQYAQAIFQYQKSLKIRSEDVKALKALSWSYFNIRFYSEALTTARKLNQVAPNDVQASIIVARTFLKLKRPKDAFRILKAAKLKTDKQDMPFLLAVEGNIHLDLEHIDKACDSFRESLKDEPLLASGLLGMGRCHLARKEYPKAIISLERAARIKPKMKEIFYYLGQSYETVDAKKSIRSYQIFGKLAATDPEYLSLLNSVKARAQLLEQQPENEVLE
jgi:tetratricopeptide (TPR) repeat protein